MSQKVIRVIYRFDSEVEDWLKVAKSYCAFLKGKDKRGRGYGSSSTAELKAIEKEIVGRFKSIESCRQWLAKARSIDVCKDGECYFLRVGVDKDSFEKAFDEAYRMTSNWKEEDNVEAFFENLKEAEKSLQGREGRIAGTFKFSGPFQLFL